MLISVLASLGATYTMITMFPQHVNIYSPRNIEVNESEVTLWKPQKVIISGDIKKK